MISDQALNVGRRSGGGRGSCEDPTTRRSIVALPIFSIHGDHDDPTREGGGDALAAFDLPAVTDLVNYFGGSEQVTQVTVRGGDATRSAPQQARNPPAPTDGSAAGCPPLPPSSSS